jgi:hypothetical protein
MPPVYPMLFGMSTPSGASTRAVAVGGRFNTLSRMTSKRCSLRVKSSVV